MWKVWRWNQKDCNNIYHHDTVLSSAFASQGQLPEMATRRRKNVEVHSSASLVAQLVKNLPVMQENWVWSLGWEDPLKKGMATHSSILAWRIPMDCIIHMVTKSQTQLSNFRFPFHFHSSASVLGVLQFSSVQLLSCVRLFCDPMDYNTPGFPVHYPLPELAQTHVYLVSDAIQPSHSLSSPSPPTFNRSQHQGLFQWIRWAKYWSFSFNISPSSEHSGLISFRMDWLDLLAVQGTLRSLLQHHSSKASILQHSPFFIVQLSHQYMTTGKTIALARRTFVGKVMSLLFNMLSWS